MARFDLSAGSNKRKEKVRQTFVDTMKISASTAAALKIQIPNRPTYVALFGTSNIHGQFEESH